MFVGGEFYTEQRWLQANRTIDSRGMHFLNGGRACLRVIADYLRQHGIHSVLLPDYLCPSIAQILTSCGLQLAYYQVNPDLSVDTTNLLQKHTQQQAVYFINYFGFLPTPQMRFFWQSLQAAGTLLIEDNAQAGFVPQPLGDFVFNSLRKWVPYDGAYLFSRLDLSATLRQYPSQPSNPRLALIRAYRAGLAAYLLDRIGDHETLTSQFAQAESYYESTEVIWGDAVERDRIEHLDWRGIRQKRRENYCALLDWLAGIPGVQPLFGALLPDVMPLGLPVYCHALPRDTLYERLGSVSIATTIHWVGTPATFAHQMLTLPIDQRVTLKQLGYLAERLLWAVEAI